MTMIPDNQNLREILRRLAPKVQTLLVEMISFPSTHGNESDIQANLETAWSAAGFAAQRHPIAERIKEDPEYSRLDKDVDFTGRDNLVVRVPGSGSGRSIILNSHVDVVPAQEWPEAFDPKIEDDWIYGRGACDAKGNIAAMYLTALALREAGLSLGGDVIYQMVIDEEVGGNGSLALIREGIYADGVVVLEPTGLAVHPANRGAIWFRFELEGKPCHMGRKEEGINAIDLAHEAIDILYEYEKDLIRDKEDQPLFAHFKLPAQVNIGVLQAGEFPSIVAGSAVMEGGIGFLPNRSMAQVKQDVVRRIETRGSDHLKAGYKLTFPKLHNDSFEIPVNHPLVQTLQAAAEQCGARSPITGWNVSCDARLFAKIGGMPAVVFGPGNIADAHSKAEKISMAEIITAAEILVRFIVMWCGAATQLS